MRPLILSVTGGLVLAVSAVWAQSSGGDAGYQVPVGQVYKEFHVPYYQGDKLKFTLTAASARGITINRAETTDLKIDIYENDKVTTTITSPKADLYVADHKMRTHDTVEIDRADLVATAKLCDFDLTEKQYTLRNNVKVVLKNFDAGKSMAKPGEAPPSPTDPGRLQPAPVPAESAASDETLMQSPGAFSSTNAPSSSP